MQNWIDLLVNKANLGHNGAMYGHNGPMYGHYSGRDPNRLLQIIIIKFME